MKKIVAGLLAFVLLGGQGKAHADVILSRIFQTETLDGLGRWPNLKLTRLYVDQFPPDGASISMTKCGAPPTSSHTHTAYCVSTVGSPTSAAVVSSPGAET